MGATTAQIQFSTADLEAAIRCLQSEGYHTDTPPPELVMRGTVLTAWHPAKDDGYLLAPAEVRLLAHYGTLKVLDPGFLDSRPRYERDDTRNRAQAYVEAAMARAVHEMRATGEGGRNNALSRLVYGLGRLEALGLQHERVFQEMLEAAMAVGLPHAEAKATLEAAWKKGAQNPAELKETPPPSRPEGRSSQPWQRRSPWGRG